MSSDIPSTPAPIVSILTDPNSINASRSRESSSAIIHDEHIDPNAAAESVEHTLHPSKSSVSSPTIQKRRASVFEKKGISPREQKGKFNTDFAHDSAAPHTTHEQVNKAATTSTKKNSYAEAAAKSTASMPSIISKKPSRSKTTLIEESPATAAPTTNPTYKGKDPYSSVTAGTEGHHQRSRTQHTISLPKVPIITTKIEDINRRLSIPNANLDDISAEFQKIQRDWEKDRKSDAAIANVFDPFEKSFTAKLAAKQVDRLQKGNKDKKTKAESWTAKVQTSKPNELEARQKELDTLLSSFEISCNKCYRGLYAHETIQNAVKSLEATLKSQWDKVLEEPLKKITDFKQVWLKSLNDPSIDIMICAKDLRDFKIQLKEDCEKQLKGLYSRKEIEKGIKDLNDTLMAQFAKSNDTKIAERVLKSTELRTVYSFYAKSPTKKENFQAYLEILKYEKEPTKGQALYIFLHHMPQESSKLKKALEGYDIIDRDPNGLQGFFNFSHIQKLIVDKKITLPDANMIETKKAQLLKTMQADMEARFFATKDFKEKMDAYTAK